MRLNNIIVLWLLLFTSSAMQGQDKQYFYYYQGEKISYELNTEFVFLSLEKETTKEELTRSLGIPSVKVAKMDTDNSRKTITPIDKLAKSKQNELRYWAEVELNRKMSEKEYLATLAQLKAAAGVSNAFPYFKKEGLEKVKMSDYFYVKLKDKNDINQLFEYARASGVEVIGHNKFMPLWFTLTCPAWSKLTAMDAANKFYESGLFAYAEPDLMVDDLSHAAGTADKIASNDTYFNDQWGLENTGQNGGVAGIDLKAELAWDITTGDPSIIVAVLDHGFEQNHPDLQANNFGTGFDTESGTSPALVLGVHGTPCAGIIGAEQDNNLGVSGVAPDASLMSISNSLVGSANSRQRRADGINWAWQNGAAVISNSWGSGVQYQLIDDAITNALTNGRGGLGTVIVFSSGNNNSGTSNYPGNSNPLILNVGAVDRCGARSGRIDIVPESCDPWCAGCQAGSAFGTTLDVVAPGTSVSTTDRQGNAGYNSGGAGEYANTDYTNDFGGTSSACPFVAGVAALVLSADPTLTVQEVNTVIEQSAQKTRPDLYPYSNTAGRPNGDWNNEMGYGFVNAHQAVLLAGSCAANVNVVADVFGGQVDSKSASNNLTANNTIYNNGTAAYTAGNKITLNPGFEARAGSSFHGYIAACNSFIVAPDEPEVAYKTTDDYYTDIFTEEIAARQPSPSLLGQSMRCYPNPFATVTTIEFELESATEARLSIHDLNGRLIKELVNGDMGAGTHQVTFEVGQLTAGMYYAQLQAADKVETARLMITK